MSAQIGLFGNWPYLKSKSFQCPPPQQVILSTVKNHGNKVDSQFWEWHIVNITSSLLRIIAGDVHCHRREHGACSFPWHTNSGADKGFHVHLATAHDCVHREVDGVLGFTRVVLMDEDRMNWHFRTSRVPAKHKVQSTTLDWLYKAMFTNMSDKKSVQHNYSCNTNRPLALVLARQLSN